MPAKAGKEYKNERDVQAARVQQLEHHGISWMFCAAEAAERMINGKLVLFRA